MKIIILTALKDWIINKFNIEKWKIIAEAIGIGVDRFNNQDSFLSDDRFRKLISQIILTLDLQESVFVENFIQYWMTDFAPRLCQLLTKKSNSTKEFLINIIKVNNELCRLIPNKFLAKIDLQEMDGYTLTAIYASEKSLVDIVALLRGVSNIFSDTFTLKKINPHSVEIKFEKK